MRRFRNRDPAAPRAAYDRHGRAVFALALLALEAHHNAEDVTRLAGRGRRSIPRAPTWAAGWRDHPAARSPTAFPPRAREGRSARWCGWRLLTT